MSLPELLRLQDKPSRRTPSSTKSSGSKKKGKRGKLSSKAAGVGGGKGAQRALAAADSASLSGGASADWTVGTRLPAEGDGPRADWVDPTRGEDVPVQEVGALKKRLVASERERKQALAEAAAENRALQLQLQVCCARYAVLCCAVLCCAMFWSI